MRILAIGAHPGDIEFGCGGTLYKYHLKGQHVELLILSNKTAEENSNKLKSAQEASAKLIGAKKLHWGGFTNAEIQLDSKLIDIISTVVSEFKPNLIMVHSDSDSDLTHKNVNHAVLSVCKNVKNILYYETPTSYSFAPSVIVDISSLLSRKMEMIQLMGYGICSSAMKEQDLQELATSVSQTRGMMIQVHYAEGFVPYRLLINI